MRIGSLFSGCGALDLGLPGHTAWLCESDPHARRVLEHRFPGTPILPDVRDTDALAAAGPVDMLAGGFPCQDFSVAGKGAGFADGTRSALWFAYADAVRALRPQLVFIENVPGIFGKVGGRAGESAFGTVIGDLAEAGYVGSWCSVRASDVGAPHRRERVFWLATDTRGAGTGRDVGAIPSTVQERTGVNVNVRAAVDGGATPADADDRRERRQHPGGRDTDGRDRPNVAWGTYEPAIRQWEAFLGRPAARPTDDRGRLNPVFVEWMQGLPEGWVTDPDIGVSRTQQLRILGNLCVPQQAALAYRTLVATLAGMAAS